MNILYLNTHDIGRYLSVYGQAVESPHLARLAEDCAVFTQCHCASPTCSPSRGALLTGQYPHNNGLIGLSHRGFEINGDHHLAAFLHNKGYETVLSGVQHEVIRGKEGTLGYERSLNGDAYFDIPLPECEKLTMQDRMAAKNAAEYLLARKKTDRPFFLAVGFGCTHRAYPNVEGEKEAYLQVPPHLPSTEETRRDMATMHLALKTMDACCGEVLNALRESGQYEDTLILFTTDHGLPMPRMKCCLYDAGTGVTLMMKIPGFEQSIGLQNALVSQIDVFPTLCEVLGVAAPNWLEGVSLMPLLRGDADRVRDAVYAEINYHVAYQPVRSVRTDRWKLICRGEDSYDRFPPANVDDSAFKELWNSLGYFDRELPRWELYDLVFDPQEEMNLAEKPEYADTLSDMQAMLLSWQRETHDPLLTEGKVELPPRAICSTPDSYSTKSQVILPECRHNLEALRGVLQNVIR